MEELEKAVNTAVRGYLAELERIEYELLVRLCADLADDELPCMAIPRRFAPTRHCTATTAS